jgi:hypothetical protein
MSLAQRLLTTGHTIAGTASMDPSPVTTLRRIWLILLLITACATLPPAGSPAAHAELERPVALDLDTYVGRLRQLSVTTGEVSLPFLFDTGGGISIVTPSVAARIGCEPYGRGVGFRMSGEKIEYQYCDSVTLTIDGERFRHPRIAVFDVMGLLPEGLPELGGVVSLATFGDRALTVDLAGGLLIVETEATLEERASRGTPLIARFANGSDG